MDSNSRSKVVPVHGVEAYLARSRSTLQVLWSVSASVFAVCDRNLLPFEIFDNASHYRRVWNGYESYET